MVKLFFTPINHKNVLYVPEKGVVSEKYMNKFIHLLVVLAKPDFFFFLLFDTVLFSKSL